MIALFTASQVTMASAISTGGEQSLPAINWSYPEILLRLGLGLALGLLIGLERERRHKEAGLRTFGFVALSGAMGGAMGEPFALMSLLLTSVLLAFLNLNSLRTGQVPELTTSAAMLVTCFAGILCGQGHTLTPAAVMVITTALLAWKQPLSGFSMGLTEKELRSAVMLAILAIVIYPALPEGPIGPHELIVPRQAWLTVLLLAGIGIVNYVLLKIYGSRGTELAGFLGGLVNSRIAIVELAGRVNETRGQSPDVAYRSILLAISAMLIRNAVILGVLAPRALLSAGGAFVSMFIVCVLFILPGIRRRKALMTTPEGAPFALELPFSLGAALKYGSIFVFLQVIGNLAQQSGGQVAFYLVSFLGGLASSASSLAAAGNLAANGIVSTEIAGVGAVIATVTSVLINLPFVIRSRNRKLTGRVAVAMAVVSAVGVFAGFIGPAITPPW